MNIIVKTCESGRFYCRPDTTWEREDKDLFSPDFVDSYLYTPVLFARIDKAGKHVGRKFAERYYNSIGYGMLLYAGNLFDGTETTYASASCLDHTSILPFPMYNRVTLENGTNEFRLFRNGKEIFSTSKGSTDIIEDAISEASPLVSMRIGDMIAIELMSPQKLTGADKCCQEGQTEKTEIYGTFCENELFRFNIVF